MADPVIYLLASYVRNIDHLVKGKVIEPFDKLRIRLQKFGNISLLL